MLSLKDLQPLKSRAKASTQDKPPTIDKEEPTINGLPKTLSVIIATNVVPTPSPIKLLTKRNRAERRALNWLGANICNAVAEITSGKEAKNIAGMSRVTESQS